VKALKSILLFFWYSFALGIILIAIIAALLGAMTPIINDHKADVEKHLSVVLGYPISIGKIEAHWLRFGPVISFDDVVLMDGPHELLRAKQFSAHLGVFESLFTGKPYFRSLSLSGAHLRIEEVDQQHYLLNDVPIDVTKKSQGSNAAGWMGWLFLQSHITLNDVNINYIPLHKKSLRFKLTDLELAEQDESLQIYAKLFLKDWQAEPIIASVKLSGSLQDYRHLSAQAYLYTNKLNLVRISKQFHFPFIAKKGTANVKFWLSWANGGVQSAQSQLEMGEVELTRNKHAFAIDHLRGHFAWLPENDGWKIVGENFDIRAQGQDWDTTEFEYIHHAHYNRLALSFLDVDSFSHELLLSDVLPDRAESVLSHLDPKGNIHDLTITIPLKLDQLDQYQFAGNLDQVSIKAYQSIPAVSGVSGKVIGSTESGQFDIQVHNGETDIQQYFDKPIVLSDAKAQGAWQLGPSGFGLTLTSIQASNENLSAKAALRFVIPKASSKNSSMPAGYTHPWISLVGQFKLNDGKDISEYLPVKKLNVSVRNWLRAAFVSGEGAEGKVIVRGELADFPYLKHTGTFLIESKLKDLTLHFADGWPDIVGIDTDFQFKGASMSAKVHAANLAGIHVEQADVTIPDISASHALLKITGISHETSEDLFDFIHSSPLNSTLGEWLKPLDLKGKLKLDLNLRVPLDSHISETKIDGHLYLNKNRLELTNPSLVLTEMTGKLSFDNNAISSTNLSGQLGKHPINISMNTLQDKSSGSVINLLFDGKVSASDISTLTNDDTVSNYLSGETPYQGYVLIPLTQKKAAAELSIESNLLGMQVIAPEPFQKKKEEKRYFSLSLAMGVGSLPAQIDLVYGKELTALMYYAEKTKGSPASLSIEAKASRIDWPLDLENSASSASGSQFDLIHHVTFSTPSFSFYHVPLTQFSMTMDTDASDAKIIKINSQEAKGTIEVPEAFDKQGIKANLSYLILQKKMDDVEHEAETSLNDIPPLDIKIDRLTIDKHFYGKASLKTSTIPAGVHINALTASSPLFTATAMGDLTNKNNHLSTHLVGELSANDTGKLIKSYGVTSDIEAGKGKTSFDLRWPAAPYQFKVGQLTGTAHMTLKDGVIPVGKDSVSMGVGKVLSLFSVESIKRRLKFDFSDLSDDGYSFNDMRADVSFSQGNAVFSKSYFDGPQAKIAFNGAVNLKDKKYGNTIVVTPYVTSTIPIIATIAGGPIAGVAAYAVDKLVSSGTDLTAYTYYLTGPWSNPKLVNANKDASSVVPVVEGKRVAGKSKVDGNNDR
jgi:uncharacterized protein (TIGR02099 family)